MVSGLGFGNNMLTTRLNSQANIQNSSQKLLNMLANPFAMSPEDTFVTEKKMMQDKLTNETLGKCAEAGEDGAKKRMDNWAKKFKYG